MRIVGVDLGKKGSIAYTDGTSTIVVDMPVMWVKTDDKRQLMYDRRGILALVKRFGPDDMIFIEGAQILPRGYQVKTNIIMARCEEMFIMSCEVANVPYKTVNPKDWQKAFGISGKKGDTGDQSIAIAKELFPNVEFVTPKGRKLDGRADALLIAMYAKRHMGLINNG